MRTGKRLAALLLTVLLLCCSGVTAYAHDVPDLDRLGTINISMHCGETAVPGGTLTIYRVGDIHEDDGNYSFVPSDSFAGCVNAFDNIQSPELAQKLAEYAKDINGLTQEIDGKGKISFIVEPGLYLLVQNKAAEGYLAASPFLVSVPMNEDGTYVYDVDASPKVELKEAPQPTPTPTPTPSSPTLPQTGQLNWPVPVLALFGLCLFSLGWLLRFGKKKDSNEK